MVRINIINPRNLADQHLMAEYYEIIMLVTYARKHPGTKDIPKRYCLAKGHIKFFKNRLGYLKKRHEQIRKEMKRRGFKPSMKLSLKGIPQKLKKSWRPCRKDKELIKKRLIWKLKQKKGFYRYCGKKKPTKFFVEMVRKA